MRRQRPFCGHVVGPGQFLVLCAAEPMSAQSIARVSEQIPDELRGRVVVVSDSFTPYVLDRRPT